MNEYVDEKIKAIENPMLLLAIKNYSENNSDETANELVKQLKVATFLAAMMDDSMKVIDGIVQEGSTFSLGIIKDDDGKSLLPIFTDWVHLSESVPGKSGFVMGAEWAFSMGKNQFDGVVINHTGMALPIYKGFLASLFGEQNA